MYFDAHLKEIAFQYFFVKHPVNFIEGLYYDDMPSDDEILTRFKGTDIYNTLKFNIDDDNATIDKKKEFGKAFTSVLNSAGLAIESVILSDLDKIMRSTKKEDQKSTIYSYLSNSEYYTNIQSILPFDENPIDKLSYAIFQSNFDEKYLDTMRNMKYLFLEVAKSNQNKLQVLKYDLLDCRDFNYNNVKKWIIPIYESNEKIIDDDDDVDENQQAKKLPRKSSQILLNATARKKILTVEEALNKNFEGLIGLKDVKNAILRKTKLIQKIPSKAVDCNFRIVGNPGVGKTTVAEAMSKTFYDAGIIKNPQFVQLNGAGLKGKYVGHTVDQVKNIFAEAKGGTLFLDEVYSLLSPSGSEDSFTQEAITQLMIEVENAYKAQEINPEDKTLIIMAGYKDKLDALLDKNIGFKRRFPNEIAIKDYSIEELEEIFNALLKKDGFTLTDKARGELLKVLEVNKAKKNFSNAGFVRNLLQKAEEYQAGRAELDDLSINEEDIIASGRDFEEVIEEKRIGF